MGKEVTDTFLNIHTLKTHGIKIPEIKNSSGYDEITSDFKSMFIADQSLIQLSLQTIQNICVCVCVCIYIYIYTHTRILRIK